MSHSYCRCDNWETMETLNRKLLHGPAPINVKPHYPKYRERWGVSGGLALKTRPMGTFHHDHGKEGFGAV